MNNEIVRDKLNKAKESGIEIKFVAQRTNIKVGTLYHFKRGDCNLSFERLMNLNKVLDELLAIANGGNEQ